MSTEQQEIAKFLGAVSLFKNVKPDFLAQIASRVEEKIFSREQVVFEAGDDGDSRRLSQTLAERALLPAERGHAAPRDEEPAFRDAG